MNKRAGQTMQRAVLTAAAVSASIGASISGACFGQGIPCRYDVLATIQGPPCGIGSPITVATAISPNGECVVGHYRCSAGNPRPFKWTESGGFQFIPLPPWLLEASPADVNDNNIMVGTGVGPVAGQRGFVCDLNTGVWTELLPLNPPIGWSGATGINNGNVVCGWRSIDDGGDPVNPQTAFIWSAKDGFTNLGLIDGMSSSASDIANDEQVAVYKGVGLAAYVWNGKRTTNIGWIPGADDIRPIAIGSGAHIVGGSLFLAGTNFWIVPLEYRGGSLRALPVLSDALPSCSAFAVNQSGLIVGHCRPMNNGDDLHAVSWLGAAIRELQPLLVGGGGMTLDEATAVNDSGQIVCVGEDAKGDLVSFLLTPILGITGDTNCDRSVNIDDLLAVIQWWGPGASYGDLNGDRIVNILDLLIVIDNWNSP